MGSAKEQVSRCNLFGVGQKGKKNKVDPTDLDSLKSHLCFLNQSTPAQLEMLLLDTKAHSWPPTFLNHTRPDALNVGRRFLDGGRPPGKAPCPHVEGIGQGLAAKLVSQSICQEFYKHSVKENLHWVFNQKFSGCCAVLQR